jgi:hypothetical protein
MILARTPFNLDQTPVMPVARVTITSVTAGTEMPLALLPPAHNVNRRTRARAGTTRVTPLVGNTRTPAPAVTMRMGHAALPLHHHAALDVNVRRTTVIRTLAFANPGATTMIRMPQEDADSEF